MKTQRPSIGKGEIVHGGIASAGEIPRDRSVPSVQLAACPTCHAAVGEKCRTAAGKTISAHGPRRRMALRAERAAAEQVDYPIQDVEYARRVAPRHRAQLRREAGLSRLGLARLLGISNHTLVQWETKLLAPNGPAGARYGRWLRERRNA